MKKYIIGAVVILLVLFSLYYVTGKEDKDRPVKENQEIEENGLSKEKAAVIQNALHNENLGFAEGTYVFNDEHYLVFSQKRKTEYSKTFPGDQLVWVAERKEGLTYQPLATGDYLLHLVMNKEKPFFMQDGSFFIVYYEAEGRKDKLRKGKGFVYQVDLKNELKTVLETEGTFHDFYLNEDQKMVFVERVSVDERNQLPNHLSPYELHYQMWENGKWEVVEKEKVVPSLKGQ